MRPPLMTHNHAHHARRDMEPFTQFLLSGLPAGVQAPKFKNGLVGELSVRTGFPSWYGFRSSVPPMTVPTQHTPLTPRVGHVPGIGRGKEMSVIAARWIVAGVSRLFRPQSSGKEQRRTVGLDHSVAFAVTHPYRPHAVPVPVPSCRPRPALVRAASFYMPPKQFNVPFSQPWWFGVMREHEHSVPQISVVSN